MINKNRTVGNTPAVALAFGSKPSARFARLAADLGFRALTANGLEVAIAVAIARDIVR